MIIWGCFGGTTIFGNTHIHPVFLHQPVFEELQLTVLELLQPGDSDHEKSFIPHHGSSWGATPQIPRKHTPFLIGRENVLIRTFICFRFDVGFRGCTLLGTNMSISKTLLRMFVFFQKRDMLLPWRVYSVYLHIFFMLQCLSHFKWVWNQHRSIAGTTWLFRFYRWFYHPWYWVCIKPLPASNVTRVCFHGSPSLLLKYEMFFCSFHKFCEGECLQDEEVPCFSLPNPFCLVFM